MDNTDSLEASNLSSAPIVSPSPTLTGDDFDFITAYADYADVLEAPREMHEAVAQQIVASVLNRNGVKIVHGGLRYPLDYWQLLLSGSGVGRSTLVGMARPILKEAMVEDLEQDILWGSPQALYQQLSKTPSGLFVWGEIAERLKLLNESRFSGAKQWITDRYDNWGVPSPVVYRETGIKDRDTPAIHFATAPRINILATSSESWFFSNLAHEDSMGGFVPRWLIVRAEKTDRLIPTPQSPDATKVPRLADALGRIAEVRGDADLTKILIPHYDQWYRETRKRFEDQPNRDLAMAYFHRHRAHVLKLAVIYEVSSTQELQVSVTAWERAVATARRAEQTIFSLLKTGMDAQGFQTQKMSDLIRDAGESGLTMTKFTRAFQSQHRDLREQRLKTLVDSGDIYHFSVTTGGRPKSVLVHEDFVQAFKKANPEATESLLLQWPMRKNGIFNSGS